MRRCLFCLGILIPVSGWAGGIEYSVGLGLPYGGIGGKIAYKTEESKYYVGIGVPAVTIGMQTVVNDNLHHSWGGYVGRGFSLFSSDVDFAAISYSYHLDGFDNQGWEFGMAGGYYQEDEDGGIFNVPEDTEEGGFITLNVGYNF